MQKSKKPLTSPGETSAGKTKVMYRFLLGALYSSKVSGNPIPPPKKNSLFYSVRFLEHAKTSCDKKTKNKAFFTMKNLSNFTKATKEVI